MWYYTTVLRNYRAAQGWTYRQLEYEINKVCGFNAISAQSLHQWERGLYEPTYKVIDRIQPFFDLIMREVDDAPTTEATIEAS